MEALPIVETLYRDCPRQRLLDCGAVALETAELIALVLGSGQPARLSIAQRLLNSLADSGADPFDHLRDISPTELMHCAGIGPARAARLLAAIELGHRVYTVHPGHRPLIDSPQAVVNLLAKEMAFARQEHFAVLLLDIKNRLVARRLVSLGTIDETIAHPREVFREAVRQGAAGIIVAHNHPSGLTEPSSEDLRLTEQLLVCGRTLQIPVLDHVILGAGSFTSLRRTTGLWP